MFTANTAGCIRRAYLCNTRTARVGVPITSVLQQLCQAFRNPTRFALVVVSIAIHIGSDDVSHCVVHPVRSVWARVK